MFDESKKDMMEFMREAVAIISNAAKEKLDEDAKSALGNVELHIAKAKEIIEENKGNKDFIVAVNNSIDELYKFHMELVRELVKD